MLLVKGSINKLLELKSTLKWTFSLISIFQDIYLKGSQITSRGSPDRLHHFVLENVKNSLAF